MSEERPTAASQETKDRFRAALDAKKAESHRVDETAKGSSGVRGSETMGSTRRVFRRKSG